MKTRFTSALHRTAAALGSRKVQETFQHDRCRWSASPAAFAELTLVCP